MSQQQQQTPQIIDLENTKCDESTDEGSAGRDKKRKRVSETPSADEQNASSLAATAKKPAAPATHRPTAQPSLEEVNRSIALSLGGSAEYVNGVVVASVTIGAGFVKEPAASVWGAEGTVEELLQKFIERYESHGFRVKVYPDRYRKDGKHCNVFLHHQNSVAVCRAVAFEKEHPLTKYSRIEIGRDTIESRGVVLTPKVGVDKPTMIQESTKKYGRHIAFIYPLDEHQCIAVMDSDGSVLAMRTTAFDYFTTSPVEQTVRNKNQGNSPALEQRVSKLEEGITKLNDRADKSESLLATIADTLKGAVAMLNGMQQRQGAAPSSTD